METDCESDFLEILARDIDSNPDKLHYPSKDEMTEIQELVKDVNVDIDDVITDVDDNSYDAIRQRKQKSQARFYAHLFESRDRGDFEVEKRRLRSKLIKPENLPKLSVKNIPDFD